MSSAVPPAAPQRQAAPAPVVTAGGQPGPTGGISERTRSERRLGWWLAGPAFAVMLLVTLYPILQAVYDSLFAYRLTAPGERRFVGLGNYAVVLTDPVWWRDLLVTVFITVVSAFAWFYAFDVTSGYINNWFDWVPGITADLNWFASQGTSLFVIIASEVWKTTPFISMLLLAGLAQVPGDMEEAAKVDGATSWQVLTRVILPNMKASIMVAVLFRALDAFRIFDNVFIMTNGANGTETLSLLAYRTSIGRLEIGLGSAVSVLLFLCVLLIAFGAIKLFKVDLSSARGE